jgi:hypothetical protein
VGLRRGRRHPSEIGVGDALDFWRVSNIEVPYRLVLVAEMKMPGEALLDFQITPVGNGQVELQMLSRFLPRGLAGILYWYGFGMLKSIAKFIGKPIVSGPERFTPKLHASCALPPNIS